MKKRMLLSLIFLLTFALGLPSTPAAEEWVLHKTITEPGAVVTALTFSQSGSRLIVGTGYNDTAYNVQVYDGNTFEYLLAAIIQTWYTRSRLGKGGMKLRLLEALQKYISIIQRAITRFTHSILVVDTSGNSPIGLMESGSPLEQ